MSNIDLANVRIETDESDLDRVWITMLDPVSGLEIESGQFSSQEFLLTVLEFYNRNY